MPATSSDTTVPPAAPDERLAGSVVRITFQNAENGYCVIKLRPEDRVDPRHQMTGGLIALVGVMPGIEVGQTIQAAGEWVRDPKFGPQFKVAWFKPMLPTGRRGIEVFLGSGAVKGVGPVTAKKIVEIFGERAFEILDHTPRRLSEVPGISPRAAAKIAQAWRETQGDRELVTFLGENGVAPGVAARLRKAYGENALAVVRSNPYRLMGEVRGIGFRRADEIAQKIGLPADAPERIQAALAHVLESQSEEGHTRLPRARLEGLAVELLLAAPGLVTAQLDDALTRGRFVAETIDGEDSVALPLLREAEQRIAERIDRLLITPKQLPRIDAVAALADFEQRTRFRLAAAQREDALTIARRGMLILTGGPGTGKTTTVRSIIELFSLGRLQVRLAAPTGRAARRLSETAKLPAETIHRLLGFQAHLGRFGRDAANPVEADLVIIDEASMLDAPLAASLFDALPPRTCLLLVGDEDQLPSVGPGNVLGDLIAAGAMPLARLTEVFRQAQSSLIVTNAHRINQGLLPWFKPPDTETREDFFFIEREEPAQVVDTIRTLVRERIPRKFQFDPRHDIQILTPMRRGELGVEALNAALRQLLNPRPSKDDEEGIFTEEPAIGVRGALPAVGDRVMQTANNYDKLVFNGDIGHVDSVHEETREVHVRYEGRIVSYLADELDQLTLAYATTIHKSQGSEYPAVIIPVHTQHWIMLQRNLIYTAITRARRLVILIGTRRALRRAIANAARAQRHTALRFYLERRRRHVTPPAADES